MHPELAAAMALILHDLAGPDGVQLSVRDEPWHDTAQTASAMLFGPDGSGMGVFIHLGHPVSAQVASLADQVQEWAVEALWALGRPATWPACPHHPASHPLAAAEWSGRALWTCPVLATEVSEIGQRTADPAT